MNSRPFALLVALVSLPAVVSAASPYTLHSFEKIRLTTEYFAEGASYGDFNHDGKRDLVCGPNWFEGPEFTKRRSFYDGKAFPNDRGYSDNFFSFAYDFTGDGWDDILVVGLPGTKTYWYENPRGEGLWKQHYAFPAVDNEAPLFDDLTGDGVPELVCTSEGYLGYVTPAVGKEWNFHRISEKGSWHKYSHGLGIGDVNGDGRKDYLMPTGWWEHPADARDGVVWKHHPARFGGGGAQIYTDDIDGDGDNDVVTSLQAHAWGLSWFEHVRNGDTITFVEHKLMGERPEDSPYGVKFSQLHAIDLVDVDGNGMKDIVAGKCYWAHNGADPGAREPAVIYWFQQTRRGGQVEFVPHLVDDDSGVGRQVRAVDMDGDGAIDIIAGNKKGTFLFLQKQRTVTKEQWEEAQPRRTR